MSLSNAPTTLEDNGVNVDDSMAIQKFGEVFASVMNEAQFAILCGRTPKKYIKTRPGKGKRTFSYVPHGYVVGVLNKAFGFNWDWEILPQGDGNYYKYLPPLMGPDSRNPGQEVQWQPGSYLVNGKLTVRVVNPNNPEQVLATIVKTATGEKEHMRGMTHGGHIKSAASDALKKAASRMGVALDLYWQDADEDYMPATEPPKTQAEFIVRLPELGLTVTQALSHLGKSLPEIVPAQDFIKLRNMTKGA